MKKAIIILSLLNLIVACTSSSEPQAKEENKYQSFAKTFQEIDQILDKDNGKFWNHSLKGPMLLVDPESREIITNHNNKAGEFKPVDGVYISTLPEEMNIANTALNWNGERWTMLMLPLPTAEKARNNLLIHELFHRIQPQIGFANLSEQSNAHLDTYRGRLLLKLELEALVDAIFETGEERKSHLANAFQFRNERCSSQELSDAENTLELNEGLAEYTGAMLSGRNSEEMNMHFKNSVNQFYSNKTFVRSFAYQTIPMYGYMLAQSKKNWHQEVSGQTNLIDYFKNAFEIEVDNSIPFESVAQANDYGYEKILQEEQLREEERLIVVANYKAIFLEKPTLRLNFENMQISFDPRNIVPIEDIGTVYPTLKVSDNWGILTVEEGALLSANWQNVTVTEPSSTSDSLVVGKGWTLELNENWRVEKMEVGYELKKQ